MPDPVKVNILDREYLVACPEEEKAGLIESASVLSERMRQIRDSGKIVGVDRIAVMAALNITFEMLQARRDTGQLEDVESRLGKLDSRLARFLDAADDQH
ncbi:MAG: cell division protein ZapA [Ectothiorhodospiraceae bacterium]|jgi:cell division protein ZapA